MINRFQARMKSVKVDLKRQLSDEEYVSDWVRFTGSDPGVVIEGIEVTRYANGKAVEHWFSPTASLAGINQPMPDQQSDTQRFRRKTKRNLRLEIYI